MAERRIDLRGLLCPLPVIRAAAAVDAATAGEVLVLECTDPGVREDLPIWARMHGHEIDGIDETGELVVVRLRVAAAPEQ